MKQETHTMTPDNLFADSQMMPVVSDVLEIAAGQNLTRGTLVTATGTACTATSGETPTIDDVYAVLAEDVDATDAAKEAAVYLTGEFNASAVTVAGGEIADYKVSARKVGIFIKETI